MRKFIIIAGLMVAIVVTCAAQSRKEAEANKIKSQTITELDFENSSGKETLEKVERFDARGNLIEIIEYDSKEKIVIHEKYEYDDQNNMTKEIKLDAYGKVNKIFVYKYNDKGLKTERTSYDSAGRKLKVKKYTYEYYQ